MRIAIVLAVLALAGCKTPCPPVLSGPTNVVYHCQDGSDLHVTYSQAPDNVHIVQEGFAPLDLPERIGSSGFRYADRGAELAGNGSIARWTRPGAAETECRETPVTQ